MAEAKPEGGEEEDTIGVSIQRYGTINKLYFQPMRFMGVILLQLGTYEF